MESHQLANINIELATENCCWKQDSQSHLCLWAVYIPWASSELLPGSGPWALHFWRLLDNRPHSTHGCLLSPGTHTLRRKPALFACGGSVGASNNPLGGRGQVSQLRLVAGREGPTRTLWLPSLWRICCHRLDFPTSKSILSTQLGSISQRGETNETKSRYRFACANFKNSQCLFLGVALRCLGNLFLLVYLFSQAQGRFQHGVIHA